MKNRGDFMNVRWSSSSPFWDQKWANGVDVAIVQLTEEFAGQLSPEQVQQAVIEAAVAYRSAAVQAFVPIFFIRRQARRALRALLREPQSP
ncbi:MAG: hypothetical protein Q9O62_06855 [Ardenticatenia bacterium]|nr:hypothetical protein [Ardenticatenia bacterium]